MAGAKFRLVLDYVPCEACLEVPVDDQELHCSLCRRLTRDVTVRAARDVAVVVEAPLPPPPPDVVVAPPEPAAAPPPPAPVAVAAAEAEDVGFAVDAAPAAAEEDGVEVGFSATTPPAEEDDVDLAFEATPPAPESAVPAADAADEADDWTLDPGSLEPEEDELAREAQAWAEAAAEEEEVELRPVTAAELAAEREPAPEPEPWPEEPAQADMEVLEVLDEPGPAPAPPAAAPDVDVVEVLEVEEVAPAPPAEEAWQDEPWPEDDAAAPAPAAPEALPEAPAMESADEAWVEPAPEAVPEPVSDPVTLLPDVGPLYAERLLAQGIQRVPELVGRDARALAKATGIQEKLLKRWVQTADLHQAGVPVAYADLLVRAGFDTPRALRRAKTEKVVREVNRILGESEETAFAAPLDAETVRRWQGS